MGTAIQSSDFPLSVLPMELQRIIGELNGSNGFPIDYTASAMLAALSVAICFAVCTKDGMKLSCYSANNVTPTDDESVPN